MQCRLQLIRNDNLFKQIFGGNRNRNAHVTNNFDPPLKARYVRLHPTECGPSNQCALRMDLLGYPGKLHLHEKF